MSLAGQELEEMARRIRGNLESRGYHYEARLERSSAEDRTLVDLARQLGPLFVPGGLDPELPVLTTRPSGGAPRHRPFDRPESIGWHNDFSTFPERPTATLIWILRSDPAGNEFGAWRVAAVDDLLEDLRCSTEGKELLRALRNETFAMGYEGPEAPARFQLLEKSPNGDHHLRFYGRALREGALAIHPKVPTAVEQIIEHVEAAADRVGTVLPATTGALLVVDNRRSLHDRAVQSIGQSFSLRQAALCFVSELQH